MTITSTYKDNSSGGGCNLWITLGGLNKINDLTPFQPVDNLWITCA